MRNNGLSQEIRVARLVTLRGDPAKFDCRDHGTFNVRVHQAWGDHAEEPLIVYAV